MSWHLLVFNYGSDRDIDFKAFVDSLDPQSQMYTLGDNFGFIQSGLSTAEISDRFLEFSGSRLFFIADITDSDYSGRMPGRFWDDFKRGKLSSAAE